MNKIMEESTTSSTSPPPSASTSATLNSSSPSKVDLGKAAHDEATKSDVVEKTTLITYDANGHAKGQINGAANGTIAVAS